MAKHKLFLKTTTCCCCFYLLGEWVSHTGTMQGPLDWRI